MLMGTDQEGNEVCPRTTTEEKLQALSAPQEGRERHIRTLRGRKEWCALALRKLQSNAARHIHEIMVAARPDALVNAHTT